MISGISDCDNKNDNSEHGWDKEHVTDFKHWLHYYVESSIPLLTITAPSQEVNKHAALIVGHGMSRCPLTACKLLKLGNLPCVDTSQFYSSYIVQDDNQIPYVEEEMDKFTQNDSFKLEAYIVPLERHVFLEAGAAVNICDTFIEAQKDQIEEAINNNVETIQEAADKNSDNKETYMAMIDALNISRDNPITIRYYLANSAEYKRDRIISSDNLGEKKFYGGVLMPKMVWVAEISSYKLYNMGYAFGEVVLDATASSKSKINSIILLRTSYTGAYRMPDESYMEFEQKIKDDIHYGDLSIVFSSFSNFKGMQHWTWD